MRFTYRTTVLATLFCILGCSDGTGLTTKMSDGESAPWFEDQSTQRGINFRYQSGHEERYFLPEIMGGGVALADIDNDGDLDAYLVQGGKLVAEGGLGNKLFINRGDGYFEESSDSGDAVDTGYGMGVAAGDYDNDGDVDLYVTNYGPNVLLKNNGNGEFEDVSDVAGVADEGWGTGAAFLDLDSDGDLDLFVVNYVNWSVSIEQDCFSTATGWSLADYCWPTAYNAPARDRLYRNNGDGTFTDVSDQAGLDVAFGNGLGVVGLDADNDGRTDVFVANDMGENQLWLNRGDLRFDDEALLLGCAVDEHGVPKSGMGVAAVDYDNDGDTDLLVVNLATQTDSFFRNNGTFFEDATVSVGLAAATKRYTRFGVALVDFNNDTRLDLYEANGAIGFSRETLNDRLYAEPDVLLRGLPDFRFKEVQLQGGTQAPLVYTGRGMAVGDVDNDGGLDLLIVNRDGPANLLMNQVSNQGNWIRFRVLDRQNRDAYAATVSADVGPMRVSRDVQVAGSYLASNDPRVHMGLGKETSVRNVSVRWTDGSREHFGDIEAGTTAVLRFGEGLAQ
ncbi:MAG: CRTAC1 family protein [Pseudomonadales bacterium]